MTINIYIDILQYLTDDIVSRKWQTTPALPQFTGWIQTVSEGINDHEE